MSSFNQNQIKNVLKYILTVPKCDEYKKGHLYPWLCSEILCSDIYSITQLFFTYEYEEIGENINQNLKTEVSLNEKDINQNQTDQDIKKRKNTDDSYDSDIEISVDVQKDNRVKKNIELLDNLFSFLNTEEDLNYVLVGYFMKVLGFLLNKNLDIVTIDI